MDGSSLHLLYLLDRGGDLLHRVLLILSRVRWQGTRRAVGLGGLGSATATDQEEGTGGQKDNDGSRDTSGDATDLGARETCGLHSGGVRVSVGERLVAYDLLTLDTHAHVKLTGLAGRLIRGAFLEEANVTVAVLPGLASQGALCSLSLDLLGHIAVKRVDIVDTGHKRSNSVLSILAGLTGSQLWDTVLVVVARHTCNRADSVLVAVVLGPGGVGVNGNVGCRHGEVLLCEESEELKRARQREGPGYEVRELRG
ncbi:hypothetical protein BC939DRAFT_433842 [Gamsiella multidivaricata]|uniref:uncharacterized protein n=1 Tax=Gamsiella multidivaricata TaxID=101098 RepID=UPI00221F4EB4|nr:uncharacterized protein BC939DRAFT_433842 [Gamsiella multidivaricata]KAI7832607.1 hypothetical protein BC939DRAFT_433842 [Gamsiella multidivaricata]